MEIMGLTKEALNYLYKHSNFNKYNPDQMPIGCGYMDGMVSMNAIMYKKKKITDNTVIKAVTPNAMPSIELKDIKEMK